MKIALVIVPNHQDTFKASISIDTRYVDPRGTTSSREHSEIMRKYSLDKHTASAYLIALKGPK